MKHLRVINAESGDHTDYEIEFVPRVGERIQTRYGIGREPVRAHYFRVKDVMYRLDSPVEHQVAILVTEEVNPEHWPE